MTEQNTLEFVTFGNPIEVSLRDLILNENFECVRLGVTKTWLSKNFPEPDGYFPSIDAERATIWQYGNIEFHFYKDILYMIFTDYVEAIDSGPKLRLEPWILKNDGPTYFSEWISALNREGRDFQVVQKPLIDQTQILLSEEYEGSVLSFVWLDATNVAENGNPKLGAIHLMSSKLMS